ncbi:MAG: indolepyruvate oxidoreductase subunit beta [Candidatus Odinarchaeota archaeon]|nr:indolepyruvate oxidoreductase subunit beta [Candidatus Odinarchaeota archaeon]
MIEELNIAFIGVGGTGVITAAQIIAEAALKEGYNAVQGEIHGLAQRGGSVLCEVRIGSKVYGPIIPTGRTDIIVSLEPIEVGRIAHKIKDDGIVIMNTYKILPPIVSEGKAEYPDVDKIKEIISELTQNIYSLDAYEIAKKAGFVQAMNIAMIGALLALEELPIKRETVEEIIKSRFRKETHESNIKALELGYNKMKDLLKNQK